MSVELDRSANEAAEWFARIRSGKLRDQERGELEAWLSEARENRNAFHQLYQLWDELEDLKAHPEMLQLREDAARGLGWRRYRALIGGLTAACLLVALVSGLSLVQNKTAPPNYPSQSFATGIGQRSTLSLADGSTVVLDAKSTVRVWPVAGERLIELVRGRAFFKVAKNPDLPFVVRAGNYRVTALGTKFGVDLRPDALNVALTEGRVRVGEQSPGRQPRPSVGMNAGYQLTANAYGLSVTKLDVRVATGWLTGNLVFDDARLADIATELSRYSARPILVSPAVADRRMSAVLPAADPNAFLSSAETLGLAKQVRRSDAFELIEPTK